MLLDLKKAVLKMRSILKDSNQSQFVIVSKAESMVFHETLDLKRELEENEISINSLVINNVMKESDSEFCNQVRAYQAPWIEKLASAFAEQNIIQVPQFPIPIKGLKQLTQVAEHLDLIN